MLNLFKLPLIKRIPAETLGRGKSNPGGMVEMQGP